MGAAPELSLLIVNYNTWKECARALESFREHAPTRSDGSAMPFEAFVIDNASPLRPPKAIARVRRLVEEMGGELIEHDENSGYSKGMNICYERSSGRWIIVSNPDVEFTPGCIDRLLRYLEEHPEAGCTVPRGFWDRGFSGRLPPNILPTLKDLLLTQLSDYSASLRRRYARLRLRDARRVWEAEAPLVMNMMSGCLFAMERSYIEELGMLLDNRYPLYYEDADLSVRINRSARQLVQVPDSDLIHLYNRSGQTDLGLAMSRSAQSRRIYYRKWYGPPGLWLLKALERFRQTRLGNWLANRVPMPDVVDLGVQDQPPHLPLPRDCERYLVQMSLDPRFFLGGGVYGSGNSWTPSVEMFKQFGPFTYYLRVIDLSNGREEELGRWRYAYTGHHAEAAVPAGEQS